jgi:HAD superfamily hydrolase (TIGR01509 family)
MLRAVIFDFNGVIVDDERIHFRMFQRVLAEEGAALTEREYFSTYLGLDDRGCFAAVLTDAGRPTRIEHVAALVERKAAYYLEALDHNVVLFPGVAALVAELAHGLALAICSGARQNEIERILDLTGMRAAFGVLVSADQIHAGKPDPAGYLWTLRELQARVPGLSAAECLVIEDAPAGVRAAQAAGMRCLAVTNSTSAEKLAHADRVVTSLEQVSRADLAAMFANA